MSTKHRPGISEAARLAGVSRWTIARMVNEGKLTATHDRRKRRVIDPAELLRVFGELHPVQSGGAAPTVRPAAPTAPSSALVLLEVKLDALERERDRLLDDLQRERAEKAKLLGVIEQQQRLITDQRQTAPPTPAPRPRAPARRAPPTKTTAPTLGDVAGALAGWLRGR